MERNRDLRRATISTVNGLPRRRQRITTLRDSIDDDRQMELQETARLRDRERLQKKDRDREFPKRRRVDRSAVQQRSGGGESCRENESTDSSDEEYYEEEEEIRIHQQNRMNQLSPPSSSLSNNRRGLRTLRSSPVLRAAADEMLGVPIPRRARSASAKRLHEYWNSGGGGFGEDLNQRRFSPSSATASLIGSDGASPSSSGASMKKKMKSVEPRTRGLTISSNSRPSSVIQDDIEIEVAEALFDLMKQSQSQSQSCQREKFDRDSTNTVNDELKRLKDECVKEENNAFSVQNEQSMKADAETIVVDSMKELKKEGRIEKEKFPDDPARELVSGDGFVNKGKVGSPKESESPSCVKVNARDIQDPTVTKADYAATVVEAKKEAKLEIDLMAPPPLPSSPERHGFVDILTNPKATSQDVQKKSETISKDGPLAIAIRIQEEKIGVISSNQLSNLDLEKPRHDILNGRNSTAQQQQGQKDQENQSPPSLLPFPVGMSSWPGVLPHPGYVPPLQAVLPVDGSARSSMTMQPLQFKFSQPRPKKCATHQHIAQNINYHQQLIKKSLSSGPTAPATLCGTKPLNLKSMLPIKKFIPGNPLLRDFQGGQKLAAISGGSGKDKNSDAAAALNATSDKSMLQQASHQAPATNFLHGHGPGFIFPLGHHQTTVMAPTNSSGPPQSASAVGNASLPSNSAGRPSVNFPLPGGSAAVSFNHPMFPSSEAASYMAILQNNGFTIPISTSITLPPFKGGSSAVPFFNSPFYSSPLFNVTQNQPQLSLPMAPVQSASQNTSTFSGSSSLKQPQGQQQDSAKISDHKFSTSATAHLKQPEKLLQPSHSSSKSDTEISRKSGATFADGLASHSAKPNNAQTSSFPVHPMNFAVIQPVSMGIGAVASKHDDPPQQGSKGRVELIPQAFALSFGSNPSTNSSLNFSSMTQNSAIFQMLPDMARNGIQMAQQKNYQASEGKSPASGGQSLNFSKTDCPDISALSTMGTSKSDGLARTINFLPSSLSGNQPFQSSPAGLTSGVPVSIPNLQQHQHQQQLIQLQKHHVHQMQLTGTAQVKASTPNSIPGSFMSSSLPSNIPVFPQFSVQTENSTFPAKWENFPRTTAPEGSSQSATSTLVNIPQLKSSEGQTQIAFGNCSVSGASFQGQQIVIKSQPMPSLIVGPHSNSSISNNTGSSLRTPSTVGKAASTVSALPSQETEASPNGPSQKSSPACRRNVASILSTCPSQLSELKY